MLTERFIYQATVVRRSVVAACFLWWSVPLLAQGHLSLPLAGSVSLDSLTRLVDRSSDVRFSFNSRKIKGNRAIYFAGGSYSLPRMLAVIHKATGLYYFRYKDHVIFQDNPPRQAPRRAPQQTASAKKEQKAPKPAGVLRAATASEDLDNPETAGPAPYPVFHKCIPRRGRVPPPPPSPQASGSPAHDPDSRWHVQVAVAGSDVVYYGFQAEAGWRVLHLVAGWQTNLDIKGWKLGLGSVLLNRDHMQLQWIATVSPVKKNDYIDSPNINNTYTLKGLLFGTDLWWCQKLGAHWLLKGGPEFDVLHTTYYAGGVATSGINVNPLLPDPDGRYYLIKAPLRVFDTFSRTRPGNWRGWIGLSVSIAYALPF